MADHVRKFYDDYALLQAERGINRRHHRIMEWLRFFGLRDGMDLLEIGCGIGTLTELIAKDLPGGRILANDISPKSIEMARARLNGPCQVEFLAGDIIHCPVDGTFDMIVLPDVLEHIPLEVHGPLFGKLARLLRPTGTVVIHSPAPQYLEWTAHNRPELLQVIDQPLHLDAMAGHFATAGLYAKHVQHYGLWTDGPDALVIALGHYRNDLPFTPTPPAAGWLTALRRRVARRRGRT